MTGYRRIGVKIVPIMCHISWDLKKVKPCSLSTVTMHWYRFDKRKRRRRICVGVLKETKKETKKQRNK